MPQKVEELHASKIGFVKHKERRLAARTSPRISTDKKSMYVQPSARGRRTILASLMPRSIHPVTMKGE